MGAIVDVLDAGLLAAITTRLIQCLRIYWPEGLAPGEIRWERWMRSSRNTLATSSRSGGSGPYAHAFSPVVLFACQLACDLPPKKWTGLGGF